MLQPAMDFCGSVDEIGDWRLEIWRTEEKEMKPASTERDGWWFPERGIRRTVFVT